MDGAIARRSCPIVFQKGLTMINGFSKVNIFAKDEFDVRNKVYYYLHNDFEVFSIHEGIIRLHRIGPDLEQWISILTPICIPEKEISRIVNDENFRIITEGISNDIQDSQVKTEQKKGSPMAPPNLFDRARKYLGCHKHASLIIEDAWEISPDRHECAVTCCKCGRTVYFDISPKEYKLMDNSKPWTFKQEGRDGERNPND